jgi:hypothetical protein
MTSAGGRQGVECWSILDAYRDQSPLDGSSRSGIVIGCGRGAWGCFSQQWMPKYHDVMMSWLLGSSQETCIEHVSAALGACSE